MLAGLIHVLLWSHPRYAGGRAGGQFARTHKKAHGKEPISENNSDSIACPGFMIIVHKVYDTKTVIISMSPGNLLSHTKKCVVTLFLFIYYLAHRGRNMKYPLLVFSLCSLLVAVSGFQP